MKAHIKYFVPILLLMVASAFFCGCKTTPSATQGEFSRFVGLDNFSRMTRAQNAKGETVLLSPIIRSGIPWNELVVSWNANAPAGTFLKIEAHAISTDHTTKFYTLGDWSLDNKSFPRTSVRGQKDADGNVDTDTLILAHPAEAAQLRVTLGGTNGARSNLKFLGLSFSNTKVSTAVR